MWARIRHTLGYRRIPLSIAAGVLFWVFACPTWRSIVFGLPVVLVGEALRVWSSGTLEKNVAIADAGPYAYTRNPLYVGNFLIGLGFVVMGHNGWLAGMFLALFPLVYIPTILEEERFLRAKFGDVYEAYLRRVPRFLPSFSAVPQPSRFRWELVKFHREPQTWYALCAGFTAVVIKAVWTP